MALGCQSRNDALLLRVGRVIEFVRQSECLGGLLPTRVTSEEPMRCASARLVAVWVIATFNVLQQTLDAPWAMGNRRAEFPTPRQ
jgi:hypothetical protein